MNLITKSTSKEDLYRRFPVEKFTIFEIPYILVHPRHKLMRVIQPEEMKTLTSAEIGRLKYATIITKKFTWSMKNDLVRRSQGVNKKTFKRETNRDLYIKNLLKEILVYIIDDGEETYVDNAMLDRLNKDFVDGFLSYFFNVEHFETMSEEEESELMRHIHSYYSYWRKINSNRSTDNVNVAGKEPPICPSIVIEVGLADRFNWSLDYIRSLSERDIRSIQILQSQKEVAEFEGSPEARKIAISDGKKIIKRSLTYKEAQEMVLQNEKERKEKEAAVAKAPGQTQQSPTPKLSKAQEHYKRLRNVKRG